MKHIIILLFILLLSSCSSEISTIKKDKLRLNCINNQMFIMEKNKWDPYATSQFLDFDGKPYTCEKYCNDNPLDCRAVTIDYNQKGK